MLQANCLPKRFHCLQLCMWVSSSAHPANMGILNPFNTCQVEKQYLPVQFAISWSLVRSNILYFFCELSVCLAIFLCVLFNFPLLPLSKWRNSQALASTSMALQDRIKEKSWKNRDRKQQAEKENKRNLEEGLRRSRILWIAARTGWGGAWREELTEDRKRKSCRKVKKQQSRHWRACCTEEEHLICREKQLHLVNGRLHVLGEDTISSEHSVLPTPYLVNSGAWFTILENPIRGEFLV